MASALHLAYAQVLLRLLEEAPAAERARLLASEFTLSFSKRFSDGHPCPLFPEVQAVGLAKAIFPAVWRGSSVKRAFDEAAMERGRALFEDWREGGLRGSVRASPLSKAEGLSAQESLDVSMLADAILSDVEASRSRDVALRRGLQGSAPRERRVRNPSVR